MTAVPAPVDRVAANEMESGFRHFMSGFPTGVAVVASVENNGRPRGLTCNSLTSVTLEPPTLLVCLNLGSGTLATVRLRGLFAVNLLHEGGRRAAEVFSAPGSDRFARVAWRPSEDTGLPWLVDDANAVAECAVTHVRLVGDHAVVLGAVTAIRSIADRPPLLYGRRAFGAWPR